MLRIDVNEAVAFANNAHHGQVRKYTGAPYIIHPVEVMNIIRYAAGSVYAKDDAVLAAAVLHDVVEDTSLTVSNIREVFGTDVASMVDDLTDVFTDPRMGNRKLRKERERLRLAKTSHRVQTIKLADMIANTHDIVAFDPGFARIYLTEKGELLKVLSKGDTHLREIAQRAVDAGWKTVGERA